MRGPRINIAKIVCEHSERTVNDNGVSFDAMKRQIPQQRHRRQCVKTKVGRNSDDTLPGFHGSHCPACCSDDGQLVKKLKRGAA